MGHKSQEEILSEIKSAQTKVVVGGYYAHYKHPEKKEYQVVEVGIYENSEEVCVVYKSLSTGISWIRTLANFLEEVEVDGKKETRFVLIK